MNIKLWSVPRTILSSIFRFSRLQTKIEKRTSSSIFVLKVLNENRKTNIVFDFRFSNGKRKLKNEHRLRFSFFKMENKNRKNEFWVEIRFSICETQNEIELWSVPLTMHVAKLPCRNLGANILVSHFLRLLAQNFATMRQLGQPWLD